LSLKIYRYFVVANLRLRSIGVLIPSPIFYVLPLYLDQTSSIGEYQSFIPR